MKIDTAALSKIINNCFDLGMDLSVPEDKRLALGEAGKKLLNLQRDLLTADFPLGTPEFVSANTDLKKVNARLQESKGKLDDIADTVTQVGQLVGVLDELLKIAMKFV